LAKEYYLSPFGTFVFPWINKPDTKFNSDGVFKTGLLCSMSDPAVVAMKDKIDTEVQAAFDRYFETDEGKKIKPAERKNWSVYVPYEEDTDDQGNPIGYIKFDFKQNAKIKLKDGSVKEIKVGIKDAKDKDMHKPVFGGSEGRVMYTLRDIPMKSTKQIGLRMDMAQVQVTKLQSGSSGPGFGEVEGGYSEEAESGPSYDDGGDY
jgi:hypothetical protein